MKRFFLTASVALLAAGCANKPVELGGASDLQVVQTLPTPAQTDLFNTEASYLVGPADVLRIDVFGMPDMANRSVRVDQSGHISFPLAGTMNVAGQTTEQIAARIVDALRRNYVREPQVSVNLETSASRSVTVFGHVREPGVYAINGASTLLRTIATAKGFSEFGREDDVVVFRTVNGQRMATLYDVSAIRRGMYEDPQIYANDIVVVDENRAKQLFQELISAATIVTTPLTILLQNSN